MDEQSFDITVRVTMASIQPGGPWQLHCPACQARLNIHQPEPEISHRLLGSCACEECGIWLSLLASPDRKTVYMIRLPAIAELWEAMRRQGLA
jgi:hypothetical protein